MTNVSVTITVARGAVEKAYITSVEVNPRADDMLADAVDAVWNQIRSARLEVGYLTIKQGDGRRLSSCMPDDVLTVEAYTL